MLVNVLGITESDIVIGGDFNVYTRIKFCFSNNKIIASVLLLVRDVWEGNQFRERF